MPDRNNDIKEKIARLKKIDTKFEIFASDHHKYNLNPCLSEEEIEDFEERLNVYLPEDYRNFLMFVCNGGPGPNYGLIKLDVKSWEEFTEKNPSFLSKPFPYDDQEAQAIMKHQDAENELNWNYEKSPKNYLPLADRGCGWEDILILEGDQRGKVWLYGDALNPLYEKKGEEYVQLDFLSWYENWLDSSLAQGTLKDDPFQPFENPLDITAINYRQKKLESIPDHIFRCINLKKLFLRHNKLTKIPDQIRVFKDLEEIDVAVNQITNMPEGLCELKKLKILDILSNPLKKLPNAIGNLTNLEILKLSSTGLSLLPDSIGELKNLKELDLTFNKLTQLPKSIGFLSNLKALKMNWNKLESLPESMGFLTEIRKLNLRSNNLKDFPESIHHLRNLSYIELGENTQLNLPSIFTKICDLANCREIYFYKCNINEVPKEIGRLKNLEILGLSDNNIKTLPEEIKSLWKLHTLHLSNNTELDFDDLMEKLSGLMNLQRLSLDYSISKNSEENLELREHLRSEIARMENKFPNIYISSLFSPM